MLLRNAMRRPRAVEYGSVSWEDLNQKFRKIFLSGGPYDTGIRGAERLSPVADGAGPSGCPRWRRPTASCATTSA